jgi:hypothetical protein
LTERPLRVAKSDFFALEGFSGDHRVAGALGQRSNRRWVLSLRDAGFGRDRQAPRGAGGGQTVPISTIANSPGVNMVTRAPKYGDNQHSSNITDLRAEVGAISRGVADKKTASGPVAIEKAA